jgi:uncharacterized membrane protein YkoI
VRLFGVWAGLGNCGLKERDMKRRMTTLALVVSLTTLPLAIACGSGERDEAEESEASEAAEASETAEQAGEAAEAAEAAESASQAELLKEATIDEAAARKTALAAVPGEITKTELENEDGLLIWSFDIKVEGKEGIEEVHVDAKTGKIVKREHESGGTEPR